MEGVDVENRNRPSAAKGKNFGPNVLKERAMFSKKSQKSKSSKVEDRTRKHVQKGLPM